jgi:LmbE family N-acetylglucosaminyl deacetylase
MLASALVVLIIALAWGIGLLRARRYRAVVRIPVTRDDQLVCRGPHRSFAVPVDSHGIELPAASFAQTASAFLAIDVAATALGHLLDPSVEVQLENGSYRQYFERGVAGTRYVNLSPAFQQAGTGTLQRIALRGSYIHWAAQGSLIVFDSPPLGNGDTLIVAPHPDDAEIAAYGLYSQRRSWIVTITSGERSPTDLSAVVPCSAEQTRWRARLRAWDSLTIPQLGGVPREHCWNLVFPDARLKQMHDNPQHPFRLHCEDGRTREALRANNPMIEFSSGAADCSWEDLVEQLRRTLDKVRPAVLVCPHPQLDPHHDHLFTSVALAQALRAGAHQPSTVLLYALHANEVPLYPFGAAESIVSLPPWDGAEWIADSIYSHPLSEDARRAKFFAVEAAHDLRVYADSRPKTARQLAATLRRALAAVISGMGLYPTAFLRRAPRPNEIYYAASVEGFLELARRATQPEARSDTPRSPARINRNAPAGS